MHRILNYVNRKWNQTIFWFHDIATKTNIKWLVTFSIWAHDKMIWELSERLQLIDGIPVTEHRLIREIDLSNHQIKYWMDYATELQNSLMDMMPDAKEETEEEELELLANVNR